MTEKAGFLSITEIIVPRSLTDTVQKHLRAMGHRGSEGFALWAGKRHEGRFEVKETIIPRQLGLQMNGGVCVTVDGEELFRINRHLYEKGSTLIAQIHSHPTDAYHSETDDNYPIATTVGSISIVVPDFAVRPFDISECAVYRLTVDTLWERLSESQVDALLRILD